MDEGPLTYTQFDTAPPIEEDLESRNPDTGVWGPLDLAGKTVRLLAQHRRTKRRFGGVATQLNVAGRSRVQYALADTDLVTEGDYVYQWEVTDPSGRRRTIPAGGSLRELQVNPKTGTV